MNKKMLILGMFVCMLGLVTQAQEVGSIGTDADTFLANDSTVYGDLDYMECDGPADRVGYLRFDLGAIGARTVLDAQLVLVNAAVPNQNNHSITTDRFSLYGLNNVAGNSPQDWDETAFTGNDSGLEWTPGTLLDGSVTEGRVTDLDDDVVGIDLVIEDDAVLNYWETGNYTVTISGQALIDFLQARADDDGLATFIIEMTSSGRRFGIATKENATTEYRPVLNLTYEAGGPSDPLVTPDNGDGTSGDLVEDSPGVYQVENVVLNFVAAGDPNDLHEPQYKIHPDIVSHNIYLQTGAPDDPNLYLYANVAENIVDPYTHDPNVSYGPLPNGLLQQATTYQWQVEEVLDNGSGGYPAGDPNNIMGSVWSFVTPSATPSIVSISYHQLTDTNGDASLTIEADAIANNYRWFKVVGEQDSDENAETDDVMLTDGGFYSGTQTITLSIAGMATDGSDDAQYYAIAYNGDPDGAGAIASAPSAVRWVWYPRLVNHYTFEDMDTSSDPYGVTTDIVSGFNAYMKSNDIGDDVPSLEPSVVAGLDGTYSLKFDNPAGGDPNVVDTQYAQVAEPYAGSYADITISAWVYWNGGGNWQRILDYGNDTDYYMFLSANTGGENGIVRFAVRDFNEQSVSAPTGSLPIGEWTYVTATLEGDTGKVFINGEWVATNASLTSNAVDYGPTTNNWIGRSQWSGDAYFNGLIDDLKIYNYARTTEQVAQDYMDVRDEWVCDTENYDLEFDYNDDCVINLADFAEVAQEWLDSYQILP